MQDILNLLRPKKNTVRSLYVLGWCLCQDTPYGTIIFTTISFCAYKDNYKLWHFLSFYIWTPTEILYKHQSMFWNFGSFDIVTIILFHDFCMLYHVWLCSFHPCDLTLLFSFLSLPILLEKKNFKWSIITKSRLLKLNQHFSSRQFVINQFYKKRNIS